MDRKKRIIITGGSGFIGSFLVEKLVGQGCKNVVVLSRNPLPQKGASYVKCDVFSDLAALEDELGSGDVVVHLACSTMPSISEINPVNDAIANIGGTLNLLGICTKKRVSRIIFASSGGTVYGDYSKPHKETDHTNPINSYGAMKLAIEKYLQVHYHLYGTEYLIARISNPYGRKVLRSEKLGAVDVFMHQAINDQPVVIWGDGENVRDYLHIEDVTDFFSLAIQNSAMRGIFNVGTGRGTSLNQILRIIGHVAKRSLKTEYGPGREVDVKCNVLSIAKARAAGWQPKHTLVSGMQALYQTLKR